MSYSSGLSACRESLRLGTLPNGSLAVIKSYRAKAMSPNGSVWTWKGQAISFTHALWELLAHHPDIPNGTPYVVHDDANGTMSGTVSRILPGRGQAGKLTWACACE